MADLVYEHYNKLNQQQAQIAFVLYKGVKESYSVTVRENRSADLSHLRPKFSVAEGLMKHCADIAVECQLNYNTAETDIDKLRAAVEYADLLRKWGQPQQLFQEILKELAEVRNADRPPT